jgi:large subunit ribosomal protein L9
MKVVLLENIKGLGERGEIKEVKAGYGMNFLIPQKKVALATSGSAKQMELELKKQAEKKQAEITINKKLAKNIERKKITIKVKAQKEKLFGALTEKDIKEALEKEGLKISSGKIDLSEPIKKIGQFDLNIKWDGGVQASFKLNVIEES